MDVTVGELEIMGALSGGVIIFGDEGEEPLLGSRRWGPPGLQLIHRINGSSGC